MHTDFLLAGFRSPERSPATAIVWRDESYSYAWLLAAVERWTDYLTAAGVAPGATVSLEADFSPNAVALLLALIERGCLIVPLTTSVEAKKPEFRSIAEVEIMLTVAADDAVSLVPTGTRATHALFAELRRRGHPGLVLFSSGSTGASKATVHDFDAILEKFQTPRQALRTLVFLLFDHIGGVNTLLYTLSNGGCVVTVTNRSPERVCAAIERHRVQLLPTSPTFLNLLLLSEAYKRHDLSSLELVTYGTEVMPESTLLRFHTLLPHIKLQQTYGLSELGILRSKSRASDSLWVRIGGDGFETRVVNGMLEIKARSAMLGYLNHASPFTADGWFQTGDVVDVDGEYVRIHGRASEIINVGGEKVYPAEVESVVQLMPGVEEVAVSAEPNAITGQLVKARVKLGTSETLPEFRRRMRRFCGDKLPAFKIPQRVVLISEGLHGARYKKMRRE